MCIPFEAQLLHRGAAQSVFFEQAALQTVSDHLYAEVTVP